MIFNYSVIIPFRDKMELLKKAINSIADRDDIQIIVIDNSAETMKNSFTHNHKKSTILYESSDPMGGAGHARNVGLEMALGKWLLFLDADDYFLPGAFSSFDKYLQSLYDVIFFNIKAVVLQTGEPSHRSSHVSDWLLNEDEEQMRYRSATPYCKMIRRNFVEEKNIRFQESRVSNDVKFSYMIGHYASSVKLDKTFAYCVTEDINKTSLVTLLNRENDFLRFQISVEKNIFLKINGKKHLRSRLLPAIIYAIRDFGIKEGFRYIKYAIKNKQNVFLGRGL